LIHIYDGNQLKMVSYDPISEQLAFSDDIQMRNTGRPSNTYSFAKDQFVGIGLFFGKRYMIMDSGLPREDEGFSGNFIHSLIGI